MTQCMLRATILFVLTTCLGCSGRSVVPPTTPSSAMSPVPPGPVLTAIPQQRWSLTGTYMGHSGPPACIPPFDGNPGKPIGSVIVIQRSGDSIDVITEHDHYVGTVAADQFSATDRDDVGGTWQCGDKRLHFSTEGHVSGRFSGDGRALVGEEGVVFRLESGETISRRWDWSATRNE
jgi:hypothetical protein